MKKTQFLLLVIGLASSKIGAADGDDRIASTDAHFPIGIVQTGWFSWGTGFLTDECHVLTARHVIGYQKSVLGRKVRFRLTPWLDPNKTNSSSGIVIHAGTAPKSRDDFSNDWAIIRLSRCLGSGEVGYIPVPGRPISMLKTVVSAGFPSDRSGLHLTIDPNCRLRERRLNFFLHDCAALPGNSGGPILMKDERSNRFIAVGMIVGGSRLPPDGTRISLALNLEDLPTFTSIKRKD